MQTETLDQVEENDTTESPTFLTVTNYITKLWLNLMQCWIILALVFKKNEKHTRTFFDCLF